MKKYGYRVTKYNPINRNKLGYYMKDEWTSITDIGKYSFSFEDYLFIEDSYIIFLISLLKKFNYSDLSILGLENKNNWEEIDKVSKTKLGLTEKKLFNDVLNGKNKLSLEEISFFAKFLLREILWGLLIGHEIEIQVGHDYYMYILTSNRDISDYIKNTNSNILFIEEIDESFFSKDEDWKTFFGYNENHFS